MNKINFITEICVPHVTVTLHVSALCENESTVVLYKTFSKDEYLSWLTPWYVNQEGKGCEHTSPGSVPIKLNDVLTTLDSTYENHLQHLNTISYFTEILKKNEQRVSWPIPPVVAFDNKKTYFILDGNHRMAASLANDNIFEIEVILLKSDIMEIISPNFAYFYQVN